MKLLRLLVGLALLTLASTSDALACSCPSSGPPCQNAFQVDVVFAGTVRSVVPLPDDDLPPLRPGEMRIPRTVRVEFDTVVPFRGTPGSKVTVLTAGSGPACGYGFKPGERYLVYANSKGKELVTGICSRTRPLSEAARETARGATLARIDRHSGQLEELDVEGILAFAERILPRASDLWVQASLDQRQRFQQLFFPDGIAFDGNRFVRTGVTAPAFSYLREIETGNEGLVDLTGIEPVTS